MKRTPESYVLKAVLDYLEVSKIPAWRMNSGAVKTGNRFFRFGAKGMADVLAAVSNEGHNDLLWIECKAPGKKQTKEQREFQSFVMANGMYYVVAYSHEAVHAEVRRIKGYGE